MSVEIEQACKLVAAKIMGWNWRMAGDIKLWRSGPWSSTLSYSVNPEDLLTGNGMVELMKALQSLNYSAEITNHGDAEIRGQTPERKGTTKIFDADTPQIALVLAAVTLPECRDARPQSKTG